MTLYNPSNDSGALLSRLRENHHWVVVCYCAAWCDTCASYLPAFAGLAARRSDDVFVWVDIEDHEALLDDHDIENFPTLLIQGAKGNVFYGPLLPHIHQLEQLLGALGADSPVVAQGPGALSDLLAAC